MLCTNCNREFGSNFGFCPYCGSKIDADGNVVDSNVVNTEVNNNPVPAPAPTNSNNLVTITPDNNQEIVNNNVNTTTDINNSTSDGMVNLIITRTSKVMGFAISFPVFVDGVKLGTLKNGKSLTCQIGYGSHTVLFKCVEKDVTQNIVVGNNHQSVEIVTHAKMGILAATISIDNILYN